jgi:hypothetical protein
MALKIETFSNAKGGNSFFKALGHPLSATLAANLLEKLRGMGAVAVYDPLGMAESFCEFYALAELDIRAVFVQRLDCIVTQMCC